MEYRLFCINNRRVILRNRLYLLKRNTFGFTKCIAISHKWYSNVLWRSVTTNRLHHSRTTECNCISFMECTVAYFISYLYRINWWTRIILLALIKTNPVFPSTWLYVSPLIAIIVGYIILGEPLNATMGIGACFILVGVFLANRSTLRSYFRKGRLFEKEM